MRNALRMICLATAFLALSSPTLAEVPGASEVLERSIAHHDPQGRWGQAGFQLAFRETRPDGSERQTKILINETLRSFEISTQREGAEIEGLLAGQDCVMTLNGSTEFGEEERTKYRLTCDRLQWLRDYYTYLWGLPMKLRDPGTRVDQEVADAWYQDHKVWTVRVSYEKDVGSDTWYFYFDQQSYALVGYRFFHDETKNDGEYIVLEGELEVEGMRIPKQRSWYVNADGRHLGDDILTNLEIQP